jgi:hypothetical protein
MIYHLFNANVIHHVPGMIEHILKYAERTNLFGEEEHFFLLTTYTYNPYLNKTDFSSEVYDKLFEKNKHPKYKFLNSSISLVRRFFFFTNKDILIIHENSSLFGYSYFFWLFLNLMGKNYCKRISIVNWGVPDFSNQTRKSIIQRILFKITKNVLNNFRFVIALSSEDKIKIEKQYKLQNVIIAPYIRDSYKEFNSIKKPLNVNNQPVRVMISHSGYEQNNHIHVFQLLERYKNENMQIICPLSYGNTEYVEKVKKEGKRIFNEKFIYIEELLSRDNYLDLLTSINVFIANTTMQTGLFVINFGLCTGLKMYLRGNNFNSIKLLGFNTNNVKELDDISFNTFIFPDDGDYLKKNDTKAKVFFSADEKIKMWKRVYDYNPKTK